MLFIPIKEKQEKVFDSLKSSFGYVNVHQAPRLEKIVVSSGTGSRFDKNKLEIVESRLARITGQKPAPSPAKKSVAAFKVREGDIVGYQVTLRGTQMNGFLDKLLNIALPRTKDFRGIPRSAIDEMGNLTIGIKEHVIFPETSDEDINDIFGFGITLVSTANTKDEAEHFFEFLGVPFKQKTQ